MIQFLADLSKQGIELWTDGDQIHYRGPRQVLTPSLLSKVKQNKTEILQLLKDGNYVSKVYPLSYPQRSLWYIYQSAPESPAYNTAMAIRILFEVNKNTLQSTLQALLIRHSCLRTTFSMEDGIERSESMQKVRAYQEVFFEQIDASTWSLEELRERVKDAHQRPFTLEKGPVFRASLFTRSEKDHVLLISIHHIVCDGWSMWTLMEELWRIYFAKESGKLGVFDTPRLHTIEKYPEDIPSLIEFINFQLESSVKVRDIDTGSAEVIAGGAIQFQKFIQHLLLNAFQRMGVFQKDKEKYHKDQLKEQLNILPRYSRLYKAMLDILLEAEFIEIKDNDIITRHHLTREELKGTMEPDVLNEKKNYLIETVPELGAYVNLVWVCVRALPEILTGKKSHMEVMFPNGSMELVEKTYRGSKMVDYYNYTIAEIVKTYLQGRIQQDASARIQILEVGAGTGGTSQFVLDAIREYGEQHQVHYFYTDISLAFTRYGESAFAQRYPFIEFKILDLESNPEEQDFKPNSIDIIFASHVIHATRSVENTLNHIKKLLKTNGLLIINEITKSQPFLILTFGLTDGWWLFEDEENRLKGSPLISQDQWQKLLEISGFRKIKFFNLAETMADLHNIYRQNVIIAESDGLIKSKRLQPEQTELGLVKLTHTYEDYVRWQAEMLDSAEGERQWHYWQKQLSGELPVLNLPLDRPRPSIQTYLGHWIPFRLDKELSVQLKNFARDKGVTLYTLLLCAYQMLLHRYTGQDDILVGCPTTGRPQKTFDGIVGHFVNTVVVRADFSSDPTVNEFIDQMRRTVLDALDHQDHPFSLLVDRLNPKRDPSRPPIFQTMFVFQQPHNDLGSIDGITDFYSDEGRMKIGDLDFESFPIPQQEGQFDMSMEMTGSEESLKGVLKYNQDLFNETSMRRMSNHFLDLLQCIVNNPGQNISKLQFIREEEKQKMLVEWNDTGREWDIKCVHELFEEQVKRSPDAIAVVFNDKQLRYRELNHRSNQLAHYLVKQGIKPDDPIGICVERSFEMIIGIMGILKAGGAYVPLDPQYPKERLSFMLDDSQISILLVSDHLADLFQSINHVEKIRLDKDWHVIAQESGLDLCRNLSAENLAYILYTSGSTGKPKGVAMPHKPLCNLIQWQNKNSFISENAKTLQFTTLTFDVSFQEIFSTLGSGGTLLLFPEGLRQDPAALLHLIKTELVERIFTPFVFLQMLAEAIEINEELLPLSLREIITAGEQLRITRSIINLFKKLNHCTLYNQYGPTEAHVVTSFTLKGEPENWTFLPPIGQPIANTRIYILDKRLNPVPLGVIGEIYIGGICLAKGYHKQPELTEKKFIKNPFSNNQERLYRTGDLARYLPDGNIEFLGRADHQVKIRGFRIELAEIEKQLLHHEDITDAVVLGREDRNGVKSLCAYIVSERELSVAELKGYLSEKIPNYMIPSYFVRLDEIPLLPNNKVDRLSLPQPEQNLSTGVEYVSPRDEVEEVLVKICQDILNLKKIGINDNLFDIGVNSLTTLTIQRRIDQFYPGKIKIPDLIQYPTISSLASALKDKKATELESSGREEQFKIFLDGISQVN